MLGIPPGAVRYHTDALPRFLPSIDDHFLKSVDYIVLDKRNMTPGQKRTVDEYIDTKHAGDKHRLITLE